MDLRTTTRRMAQSESSLPQTDDEELVTRFRRGDELAFAELYRRYQPVFFTYAARRIGDRAHDLVQAVFERILNALPSYRGPRFFSWAYRICANLVVDELRRSRPERGWTVADEEPSAATPEEELIARRRAVRIHRAIAQLPESHRNVFLLARVDGLSYAEIADLLAIPEGTVKSRMFKAVRAVVSEPEE